MKIKKIIPLLFLSSLFLISGCAEKRDTIVLKLGHGLDASHPVHIAMEFMGEKLAEKSNGTMEIKIYPSGQLGNERQLVELLQIGSLAMTKVAASVMENFSPLYTVLSLPYVFNDDDHRFSVLDSEIGTRVLISSEEFLVRGLSYYDAGCRSFYTIDKQINTPDDLNGLKIRVMESQTAMKMVRSLSGSPTPISWGELYTALQQGVVDGAENNPPSFYLSKHYEVCKYYSIDEHTAVPDVLIIGTKAWNELTEKQQGWLQEAVNESAIYQRKLWKEASEEAISEVKKAGVTVVYPDKEPFQKMVEKVYEEYKNKPEIYNLLKEIKEYKNDTDTKE